MVANWDDNFDESLDIGRTGENIIARWLRKRNWLIMFAYEKEIDNGKGPRLFLPLTYPESELISPDILAMRGNEVKWIEAKNKGAASYYRKKQRWQTGIDKRHHFHYRSLQEISPYPVWLLFLQRHDGPTNAPPDVSPCPTGLYGCPVAQLPSDEGFFIRNGRKYPMVYWGIDELRKLATLEEVIS